MVIWKIVYENLESKDREIKSLIKPLSLKTKNEIEEWFKTNKPNNRIIFISKLKNIKK